MRLRELSIFLSEVKHPQNPKLGLEAYTLDPDSAAKIIFLAEGIHHDLSHSTVADLGCGSGILSIGASTAGADAVVAVDLDPEAVAVAVDNSDVLGADVEFIVGDIDCLKGPFDVAVMNPPFGTRARGTDMRFLTKGIKIAETIYSLHKRTTTSRDFISNRCSESGGRVDRIYEIDILLRPSYVFHRKRSYNVKADLYRVLRTDSAGYI